MVRSVAWLAVLAALAPGCSGSRTEVVVVTDSDLAVPGELDEVLVVVTSPEGRTQMSRAGLGMGNASLPRTLGLAHESGALGPFAVVVTGRRGGAPVVTREAEFTFQPGRSLRLDVDLLRSCATTTCGAGETCAAGGCRAIALAPSELREWAGSVNGGDGGDGGTSCGDTSSDPNNCGSCGNVCDVANGTAGCAGGSCTVASCDSGFDDCNDTPGDGCEANLNTSRQDCGMCGNACGRRTSCMDGTCN